MASNKNVHVTATPNDNGVVTFALYVRNLPEDLSSLEESLIEKMTDMAPDIQVKHVYIDDCQGRKGCAESTSIVMQMLSKQWLSWLTSSGEANPCILKFLCHLIQKMTFVNQLKQI